MKWICYYPALCVEYNGLHGFTRPTQLIKMGSWECEGARAHINFRAWSAARPNDVGRLPLPWSPFPPLISPPSLTPLPAPRLAMVPITPVSVPIYGTVPIVVLCIKRRASILFFYMLGFSILPLPFIGIGLQDGGNSHGSFSCAFFRLCVGAEPRARGRGVHRGLPPPPK
jgi:hypothetical protein